MDWYKCHCHTAVPTNSNAKVESTKLLLCFALSYPGYICKIMHIFTYMNGSPLFLFFTGVDFFEILVECQKCRASGWIRIHNTVSDR